MMAEPTSGSAAEEATIAVEASKHGHVELGRVSSVDDHERDDDDDSVDSNRNQSSSSSSSSSSEEKTEMATDTYDPLGQAFAAASDDDESNQSQASHEHSENTSQPQQQRVQTSLDAHDFTRMLPETALDDIESAPADNSIVEVRDTHHNNNYNDDDNITVKTLPLDMDDTAPIDVNLPPQDYHQYGYTYQQQHLFRDLPRSHLCFGCLCDCKRASIMVNLISIVSTSISFATFVTVLLEARFNPNSANNNKNDDNYDPAVDNNDDHDDGWYTSNLTLRIIISAIYIVSIFAFCIGIRGAVSYKYILVSITACMYVIEVVAAGILHNYATMVISLGFLYPNIVLAYELWAGTISVQTYAYQEYSCCCRSNNWELEQHDMRQSGQRQLRQQRNLMSR